jgi:hypothetical protein
VVVREPAVEIAVQRHHLEPQAPVQPDRRRPARAVARVDDHPRPPLAEPEL